MRAMFSKEMPLGHSTSQAPVLVQFPNPSRSIWCTISNTRSLASGCPCGSNENWLIFAEANNIAEEFLHVATQAPQPIQVAASKALSAFSLGTGIALASIVLPEVFTEINPPAR